MNRIELSVLGLLFVAAVASGEERAPPATLRELVEQSIDDVQLFAGGAEEPARPLIVLRWANSTRGSEDGATVLYIHEGRPVAAACVFPLRGSIMHEFDAIRGGDVAARRKGEPDLLWQPKGDLEFTPVPEAAAPADSAANRLRQMKSLAEQFQATMLGWEADSDLREELRLLPRPLFRYEAKAEDAKEGEAKKGDILDGAVFAFVTGTDPEALLILEAGKEGDETRWRFAFVRRTSGALEGRYGEKVVWSAESRPAGKDPEGPHLVLYSPIPPELLPKE